MLRRSIALILLACAAFSSAVADTLRLGNPGEPETLDPHRYNLRLEETILTDLFLGLTTFDAAGQTVPGAAERWETSADGLRWTFHLRPGLTWSDGTPLTAADFVYAFRRLLDPRTAASLAYFMYPLANAAAVNAGKLPVTALGVAATDARTLVLTLEKPYPYLPERLLYPTAFPVPSHVIEKVGDDWVKPAHWVSNGAFTLVDWQPQAAVRLQVNPHFAASGLEAASVSGVDYLPIANEQNAWNRYRAGEVDAISAFPSSELDAARKEFARDLRLSPLLSSMYLVFNTRRSPFNDVRVREAVALAIDQALLVGPVQRAENRASTSFVPALVSEYEPQSMPGADLAREARVERARELLAAAGYGSKNPLTLTLRGFSGSESKRTLLAIAGFLDSIGVKARLQQSELKVHFADLRRGDFDVALAGWFGENNPEHYLSLWASTTGDVNYGAFADAEFDARMSTAAAEADLQRRNELLAKAEAIGIARFPVVPLYTVTVRRLVNPRLEGWVDNARDVHPARFLRLR